MTRLPTQNSFIEFTNSKYTTWYYKIIEQAQQQNRIRSPGLDKHHIIPKSLGGTDERDNLVFLTKREHYMCHLLLVKMTTGQARSKMVFAFFRFRPKGKNVNSSKSFERFCSTFTTYFSGENNPFYGKKHTPESLAKITGENHGMYGKKLYDIWVEKYGVSEANKRQAQKSAKTSQRMSGAGNPCFGKPRTQEQKDRQSKRMSGANHPNFGKMSYFVTKDGINKRIEKSELDDFLNKGWICGLTKKKNVSGSNNPAFGKKFVFIIKDNQNKKIEESNLEQFLEQGWILGRRSKKSQEEISRACREGQRDRRIREGNLRSPVAF